MRLSRVHQRGTTSGQKSRGRAKKRRVARQGTYHGVQGTATTIDRVEARLEARHGVARAIVCRLHLCSCKNSGVASICRCEVLGRGHCTIGDPVVDSCEWMCWTRKQTHARSNHGRVPSCGLLPEFCCDPQCIFFFEWPVDHRGPYHMQLPSRRENDEIVDAAERVLVQ